MAVRIAADYQIRATEEWRELRLLNPAAARMSRKGLGPISLSFGVSQADGVFQLVLKGIEGRRWPTGRRFETVVKISSIECFSARPAGLRLPDPATGSDRAVSVGTEVVVKCEYGVYSCRLMPDPRRARVSSSH